MEMKRKMTTEQLLDELRRHDIGNKILVVTGYMDLAIEDMNPDLLNDAKEALREMGDLMTLYNQFARMDCAETMPLRQIVERALGMLEIKPTIIIIGDAEIELNSLFVAIFYNLMQNSVLHSGNNKVLIKIEIKEGKILFTDNGRGVENKDIFRPGHALSIIRKILESVLKLSIKETGTGEGVRFEITPC